MELIWKCFLLSIMFSVAIKSAEATLRPNYYNNTCPHVESIVFDAVKKKLNETFVTIPATLRLFFHDCIVTGCDASTMIYSPQGDAEKDADDNISLAGDGFDTVVKAKEAVEKQCRGVVSCADILALAARDVVFLSGGPHFTVELGRLDGLVSNKSLVTGELPSPDFNVTELMEIFLKHGLNKTDLVALSGAHTVGFSHCSRFTNRLRDSETCYPRVDPTLNATYAKSLGAACPCNVSKNIAVDMDPVTVSFFDNKYYKNLQNRQGLFTSDQVLYEDKATKPIVNLYAANQWIFFRDFAASMVKLGRMGVKFGGEGEIRLDCTKFN